MRLRPEVWADGKRGNKKSKAIQGTVDEAEAKRLKTATGYDIPAGTKHIVTADCIRHIKGHNEATLEAIRHLDEFRATAEITALRGKNGEKKIEYRKQIGDRGWVCGEEWWNQNGELALVTLKKEPRGTLHASNKLDPSAYVRNGCPNAQDSIWERFV